MVSDGQDQRSIGRFGATGIAIGAIMGGGALALAGGTFATVGPAAGLLPTDSSAREKPKQPAVPRWSSRLLRRGFD